MPQTTSAGLLLLFAVIFAAILAPAHAGGHLRTSDLDLWRSGDRQPPFDDSAGGEEEVADEPVTVAGSPKDEKRIPFGYGVWQCDRRIFSAEKCPVKQGMTMDEVDEMWKSPVAPRVKKATYGWISAPIKEYAAEATEETIQEQMRDVLAILMLSDFVEERPRLSVMFHEPGCYLRATSGKECSVGRVVVPGDGSWVSAEGESLDELGEGRCDALVKKHIKSCVGLEHSVVLSTADFVDKMVDCNGDNHYLNQFMDIFASDPKSMLPSDKKLPLLREAREFYADKNHGEKVLVVARALGYAKILDRITRESRRDVELLRDMKKTFVDNAEEFPGWTKHVNAFEQGKKVLIDMSIDTFLESHDNGEAPKTAGKMGLCVNIVEACLEDYRLGNWGNAEAGLAIAFEPAGQRPSPRTGSRWSKLSDDLGATQYFPPLGKMWSDLYQTWNMAFVSHFPNNYMFYAKLFNPAVSCYKDRPEEYLHHRLISLYVHVYYELFRRSKGATGVETTQDYSSKAVTTLWSDANEFSGMTYHCEVGQCDEEHNTSVDQSLKAMGVAFSAMSGIGISGVQNLVNWMRSLNDDGSNAKGARPNGDRNDPTVKLIDTILDSASLDLGMKDIEFGLTDDDWNAIFSGDFKTAHDFTERDSGDVLRLPGNDKAESDEEKSGSRGWKFW